MVKKTMKISMQHSDLYVRRIHRWESIWQEVRLYTEKFLTELAIIM